MREVYFEVTSKNGNTYKLRDGKGFDHPSKEVGAEPVPFLYRPMVDQSFEVYEVDLSMQPEGPFFDKAAETYAKLKDEHAEHKKLYEVALKVQAEESAMHEGKFVRCIPDIMKDPFRRQDKETAKKIAMKRKQAAEKLIQGMEPEKVEISDVDDDED